MTQFEPPPPGYEVVESDDDAALTPETLRLRAPDGSIVTYAELMRSRTDTDDGKVVNV